MAGWATIDGADAPRLRLELVSLKAVGIARRGGVTGEFPFLRRNLHTPRKGN
jgi:hypothetical protein